MWPTRQCTSSLLKISRLISHQTSDHVPVICLVCHEEKKLYCASNVERRFVRARKIVLCQETCFVPKYSSDVVFRPWGQRLSSSCPRPSPSTLTRLSASSTSRFVHPITFILLLFSHDRPIVQGYPDGCEHRFTIPAEAMALPHEGASALVIWCNPFACWTVLTKSLLG